MLKRMILLVAILVQIGLFSVVPAAADGAPEPACFPCSDPAR